MLPFRGPLFVLSFDAVWPFSLFACPLPHELPHIRLGSVGIGCSHASFECDKELVHFFGLFRVKDFGVVNAFIAVGREIMFFSPVPCPITIFTYGLAYFRIREALFVEDSD